ncbi:DNA-directed RNA polymerase III subunit RPC5 [Sparganum proliferum]
MCEKAPNPLHECHFVPLHGDALVVDNVKEPIRAPEPADKAPSSSSQQSSALTGAKPTVVSARLKADDSIGAVRMASRKKTAENDSDLMYLSQLQLTPWKPARFKRYKPLNAFEDRSILMCSTEQASGDFGDAVDDFGQRECEELLLSKLRLEVTDVKEHGHEPHKQPSLDEVIRTILLKAHVIRFDKLLECLRDRFQDKQMLNATTVIPVLQRVAVLLCGWWVIKSEVLYPPNTYSEHASVPSTQLIRARDYVMAVFHRGDCLTRKTVSCITKLPALEVTEILEHLATRISLGHKGHSNHWEFHPPDLNFIRRYPEVVHQHQTGWELRIRQLCGQLKLDKLVTDGVRRRSRCSGRLSSSSDTDSEVVNLLSPASRVSRKRRRLLSLSPDGLGSSGGDGGGGRGRGGSKRTRTHSMSAVGLMSPPQSPVRPLSRPRQTPTLGGLPTPPLFNGSVGGGGGAGDIPVCALRASPSETQPPLPPRAPTVSSPPPTRVAQEDAHAATVSPKVVAAAPPEDATMDVDDEVTIMAVHLGKDPNALKREPPSPKHLSAVEPVTEETVVTATAAAATPVNQEEASLEEPERMEDAIMKDQTQCVPSGDQAETTQEPKPSGDQPEEEGAETGAAQYRMDQDPVILNFVREKLQSHPILALSELTKACQPFVASLSASALGATKDPPPPPGSEAERELLKVQLYDVALAVGARELKVVWPDIPTALPQQPLFVTPVAHELGGQHAKLHRVRDIILEEFENAPYISMSTIKKRLAEGGCEKITENALRSTIKRYCIYRHSKYFLRLTVSD